LREKAVIGERDVLVPYAGENLGDGMIINARVFA
jgi:hypothetical protein